jgi:hypothetical protein
VLCREYHGCALDHYKIPNGMLQTGLVCAGIFADALNEWHRCIITGFQDQFVEVSLLFKKVHLILILQ